MDLIDVWETVPEEWICLCLLGLCPWSSCGRTAASCCCWCCCWCCCLWRLLYKGIQVLLTWVSQWKPLFLQQVLHLMYTHSFLAWFPQSWHLEAPISPPCCLILLVPTTESTLYILFQSFFGTLFLILAFVEVRQL